MTFVDEYNRPLPGGTVLQDPCTWHEGILAYLQTGHQVMLHRSKKIGRSAMTTPEEFADGRCQVVRKRVPQSLEEAQAVVQRAWSDVQVGTRWTWWNNCRDFVNGAYGGKGVTTVGIGLGVLAVAGIFLAFRAQQ